MEGLYINSTSQNQSYNHSDITSNCQDYRNLSFILYVVTYTISAIGLPLTLVAIYALYSMVRSDHVAPIYVINLLITDLIQFCCMIVEVAKPEDWRIRYIFMSIYISALFASVGFMVCISLERMEGLTWTTPHRTKATITATSPPTAGLQELVFILYVVTYTIIAIGLLLTLVAIYALYSMVRRDHVAPIYVINLLITDLLQLCCMIVEVVRTVDRTISLIFIYIYFSALFASIGFMVCISLERYLVIAHPLWYRFRRTIRSSVVVCVLVWVLFLVYGVLYYFVDYLTTYIILTVLLLLPFPLFIFSLVGTLKALSASISVPSDEKRRIVGILVLVLLIYTLLFLPSIIWFLKEYTDNNQLVDFRLNLLSLIFVKLSPLADLFLYVFMRKGFIDKLLASVCCCRMDSNDISSPSV
ncbi:mas-related G-protein coupled receptor member A6-like [Micropterus salmoides]|uniref:mas-related G-protein coupled receptor member A6-like n=1 Tax=Micropterus salmoides TaxID=27706 RepID=UPI0018EB426F|nr:mas-related G-protein coupled receptor member A6-like [Micropterus salmoides]